jgi:hypothetical protein
VEGKSALPADRHDMADSQGGGVCGGSIVQSLIAPKSVYRCWYKWSRGSSVCSNTLTLPQDRADLAVLRAIARDVLDPDVSRRALRSRCRS